MSLGCLVREVARAMAWVGSLAVLSWAIGLRRWAGPLGQWAWGGGLGGKVVNVL